jgi:6-pyruvoyltetrahydropterin/6-carboxytetrahydropterin synthase
MQLMLTAHARFEAAHRLPAPDRCTKVHGHPYVLSVTLSGDLDRDTGRVKGADGFEEAVAVLVTEFHDRDLNLMMNGAQPTALSLAVLFMERLSLAFPRIVEVQVRESDRLTARVRRELRI